MVSLVVGRVPVLLSVLCISAVAAVVSYAEALSREPQVCDGVCYFLLPRVSHERCPREDIQRGSISVFEEPLCVGDVLWPGYIRLFLVLRLCRSIMLD
jgi:hypothetical protein